MKTEIMKLDEAPTGSYVEFFGTDKEAYIAEKGALTIFVDKSVKNIRDFIPDFFENPIVKVTYNEDNKDEIQRP